MSKPIKQISCEIKEELNRFLIIRNCSNDNCVNGNGDTDGAMPSTSASTQNNPLSLIISSDTKTNENDLSTKSDDDDDNGDEDYQDDGDNDDGQVDYDGDKNDKDEDEETIQLDEQDDDICENDQKTKIIRPRYKKECNECGKKVGSAYFATHMMIHANERIYMCSKCGKLFAIKKSCLKHEKEPHDKGYTESIPCKICKKKFVSKDALKLHQKEHSLEERMIFKCELCDNKFATIWGLKRHIHGHDWRKRQNKSGFHAC